eukprot:749455-Prorocentrum_minimum.AAC.1
MGPPVPVMARAHTQHPGDPSWYGRILWGATHTSTLEHITIPVRIIIRLRSSSTIEHTTAVGGSHLGLHTDIIKPLQHWIIRLNELCPKDAIQPPESSIFPQIICGRHISVASTTRITFPPLPPPPRITFPLLACGRAPVVWVAAQGRSPEAGLWRNDSIVLVLVDPALVRRPNDGIVVLSIQVGCPYCHPLYCHPPLCFTLQPCNRGTLTPGCDRWGDDTGMQPAWAPLDAPYLRVHLRGGGDKGEEEERAGVRARELCRRHRVLRDSAGV